jgi:putative ABC transport system permease protein
MSLLSRLANFFRGSRVDREIDEELQSHVDEALAAGRAPAEIRRSFGSPLQLREQSRDIRILPWLDSLRADAVFGWRQILKRKSTSAAAIVSLALATGACISAFRLIDALLLRPLPVAAPDRLYTVTYQSLSPIDGYPNHYDSCSYPMFRRYRAAVKDDAEAIAVSMYSGLVDLTFGGDESTEQVNQLFVSGWMFDTFGLHATAGRLLSTADDDTPGAHPTAVISYDYWTRRFGRDPHAIGRTFRMGDIVFQIVGVSPEGFNGTETGQTTDVFVPMAMKNPRTLASLNNFWLRTLLQLKPGVSPAAVEAKLRAAFHVLQEERVRSFPNQTQRDRERMFAEQLSVEPAASGRSNMQRDYRQPLAVLTLLVALVLLIACANAANLMTAQAAARAREMALRVSIGAGRLRLVQLVLVESAWLAVLATALGAVFAWWSAPVIAGMINPPAYPPARLLLPADSRVIAFALALAAVVMCLFGLIPALRTSAVQPIHALRGGDPHVRTRLMRWLIAVQVAFCFVVHLAAGLFVATFERLSHQPTGFSSERVLNLESVTPRPESPVAWEQVADSLRAMPGIEKAAIIAWPLLSGQSAVGNISINGAPPGPVFSDFVTISPGWADLMRIPLLSGRDFRSTDSAESTAIVNQAFARQYFNGADPTGQWFDRVSNGNTSRDRYQIVGLIRDARSRDRMRIPIRPTAYIPFLRPSATGAFVVRTATANPLALAAALRRQVAQAHPGFRVRAAHTQEEFNQTDTVRERLLAVLASFFAMVAMLLAGVGLYGVLDYSVLQQRREIGIRIAIGARPIQIARRVTSDASVMVLSGAAAGVALGLLSVRYVASLFFEVRATDPIMLAIPLATILAAAVLAAIPAVIRALRTDPAAMLRAD